MLRFHKEYLTGNFQLVSQPDKPHKAVHGPDPGSVLIAVGPARPDTENQRAGPAWPETLTLCPGPGPGPAPQPLTGSLSLAQGRARKTRRESSKLVRTGLIQDWLLVSTT